MEWSQTLRQAARTLRRQPALSVTIVLTLALGIGANSLMFSLHQALVNEALPFREPAHLLALSETVTRTSIEARAFSYPDFLDLRARVTGLESLAAYDTQAVGIAVGEGAVERVFGERIGADYFATLGVEPEHGRTIDGEREADAVVIGARLAERLLGTAGSAVDAVIRLDGHPYAVAGVMPPVFRGASDQAEIWFPMTAGDPSSLERRGARFLSAIGRLEAGATIDSVRAELTTIFDALAAAYPQSNEGYGATAAPLAEDMLGDLRAMAGVLLACVAFVMLAACLNLSNLLISRAATRGHEDVLRLALGAGRLRLAFHAAAEISLLTCLGGLGALLVAQWGVELLRVLLPVTLPTFVDFRIDGATFAFTVGLALATGFVLTALLSLGRSGRRASGAWRGLRATTANRDSSRLRATLVAGQIGLALALTIGAGLLARSVLAMGAVDLGLEARGLQTFRIDQPRDREALAAAELARTLAQTLSNLPGVDGVTMASDLPLDGSSNATLIAEEGQTPDQDAVYGGSVRVYHHRVDHRFFHTLGIPLLEGRGFVREDIGGETTSVVVSRRLAEKLWPGGSALGQRLRGGRPVESGEADDWLTVIGVVADVRHRTLVDGPETPRDPDLYLPLAATSFRNLAVAVRGASVGAPSAATLRTVIEQLDPQVPVYAVTDMAALVARRTGRARFSATMMSAFATISLLLATIGVYGTVSFAVAQRTREIGIRMAVGATRGAVLRLLLGEGMKLVLVGSTIGAVAALAMVRLLRSQLVSTSPTDPMSFLVAILLVSAAAGFACALPARRASRLDPARVLGTE